ncbi:MAG TPA: hypothetical protein VLE43_01150 [Candidatus Saccharimonadia bacterium]|nr:hypothetical protein [Candidatus Saccharimonadia bacterium]
MNESEFETDLRRFAPATPSSALAQGIAASLDRSQPEPASPARPSPLWIWLDRLLWSGLGATAAVAITLAARPQVSPTIPAHPAVASASSAMQKVLTSDEALDWQDEGVHFDANGQPMLRLRRMAVEHQAWADPQNAGIVQVEVPRQEVMYVPVQLH